MMHRNNNAELSSRAKDTGTRSPDEVFAITAALGLVPAIGVRRRIRVRKETSWQR